MVPLTQMKPQQIYFISFNSSQKKICYKIYNNWWTSYFCWWISCTGTTSFLRAIKHQLELETTTTATYHRSSNTHNTSNTKFYSSVSEISTHTILYLPQLVFSLSHLPRFELFLLISFSLVVVASDLIFHIPITSDSM